MKQCITGNTLVYTDKGIIRIKELCENNTLAKLTIDSRMGQTGQISNIINCGEKQTYELTTKEGYAINIIKDCKIRTPTGWKEVGKLTKGDEIQILNHEGMFGTKGTGELGQILGWLISEGTFNINGACLGFWRDDRALAGGFAKMVEKILPLETGNRKYNINVTNIEKRKESRITSKRLERLANSHGIKKGDKHHVPDIIYKGTKETQKRFLQSVFSANASVSPGKRNDGKKPSVTIRLSSSKPGLLSSIQILLLNFGIASRIYLRKNATTKEITNKKGMTKQYNIKASYDLVISKQGIKSFYQIGFLNKRKQDALQQDAELYSRGFYKESFVVRFDELIKQDVEQVYAIESPTNSFVANGITVANCNL